MSVTIEHYINPDAQQAIATAIRDVNGSEVFFLGALNSNGCVEHVRVIARGTDESVPAILPLAQPGEVAIHNHPSGVVLPSENDVAIASTLGNNAVGFYIVDNSVSEIYVVVEPMQQAISKPLDPEPLDAFLQPGGKISRQLSNYEYREGQLEMMHHVIQTFNEQTVTAIEAGTGTGKTLAYLLPAIHWALQNRERCVISTNTINLQEQLIHKDVPFLGRIIDEPFKTVLVKGRSNYLCLRKAEAEERELPSLIDDAESSELREILDWSKRTRDGSLADLHFVPQPHIWERINCEADTCTRIRCPLYEKCFLFTARREAALAQILIVNHHLLFADLALRSELGSYNDLAVLPPYNRIIVDEAHHIENTATSYFGTQISRSGIRRLLSRIYTEEERKGSRGILSTLRTKLGSRARGKRTSELTALSQRIDETLIPLRFQCLDGIMTVCERIEEWISTYHTGQQDELKVRLTAEVYASHVYQEGLLPAVAEAARHFRRFVTALHTYLEDLNDLPDNLLDDCTDALIDLKAMTGRVEGVIASLHEIFEEQSHDKVRWLELRKYQRGTGIAAVSVPLHIAEQLQSSLFEPFKSVLMTSATITVDKSFAFFNQRLGLQDTNSHVYSSISIPSPFDYQNQVIIGVPTDIPNPSDRRFQQAIIPVILECLKISKGKALVLFTSYAMLHSVYKQLEESLFALRFTPMKQGGDTNARLLETFRADIHSVLFATSSFWEGIDVEGEALESVILVKLPFVVPTDPLHAARTEEIEQRGENGFYGYSVPLAALRLKQGFGRLIRRITDQGSIVILDSRIVKKSYGQIFLNTLPDAQIVSGPQETVSQSLRNFFSQR